MRLCDGLALWWCLGCPRAGRAFPSPCLVGRAHFMDWDSEISGCLLFQPSDSALMFKYKCVLSCITENSAEAGKSLKFSNKQHRVAWIPGWEINPSQCVGQWMSPCQDSCPSCPAEVWQQCQLCAVLPVPVAPGDAEAGGLRISSWMGTLWAPSCCSIPLSALLGHSEPEAFPLMFPAAACVCTCCQILLQQVVLSLVLQLGTSCRPCWSSLEPGQLSALRKGCSGGGEGAFSPCSPWELMELFLHIHSWACCRKCIKIPYRGKGSSSSCFYEKCWLSGCGSIQGQGWGRKQCAGGDGLNLISGYSSTGGGVPASDGNGSCCSQLLGENYLFV